MNVNTVTARSNFEIGGTIGDSILGGGGIRDLFLLTLYNFKSIGGGGHVPPGRPIPQSLK